jgi:hypothetical protein
VKASRRYGDYFGSIFYLKGAKGKGATVALLWAKENKYWKIVSYEVEPEGEDLNVPDLRSTEAETAGPAVERIEGDPSFTKAARSFLTSWMVEKDYDAASGYLSPRSYPCVNLFLGEDESPIEGNEALARRLRAGLEDIGTKVGEIEGLDEILQPILPDSTDVLIYRHPDEAAFTLGSVPDYLGDPFDCSKMLEGVEFPEEDDPPKVYGTYAGTAFSFKVAGGEPPIFYTVWAKENGDWKLVAYQVMEP